MLIKCSSCNKESSAIVTSRNEEIIHVTNMSMPPKKEERKKRENRSKNDL